MERGDDLWHKKVFRIFFYLVEKNILYVFIMVYIKKLLKNFYEFFRFTGLIYFLPDGEKKKKKKRQEKIIYIIQD